MSDKARGDWWADKAATLESERNEWMDYARELKAENESLRKDAERWQWLREKYWIQEVIDNRLGDSRTISEMEALIDADRISSPENPS